LADRRQLLLHLLPWWLPSIRSSGIPGSEGLTKGLEIPLPAPYSFHDKDGHVRHSVRIRWWDRNGDPLP
jgi:hypothetical protein